MRRRTTPDEATLPLFQDDAAPDAAAATPPSLPLPLPVPLPLPLAGAGAGGRDGAGAAPSPARSTAADTTQPALAAAGVPLTPALFPSGGDGAGPRAADPRAGAAPPASPLLPFATEGCGDDAATPPSPPVPLAKDGRAEEAGAEGAGAAPAGAASSGVEPDDDGADAGDAPGESPAGALAAALCAHVERWSLRLGAPADAARAAAAAAEALSLATAAGHVCLPLDELADDAAALPAWRQRLAASRVVGAAAAPGAMPLVLDADDRLYLHRDFDHERALAARLKRAARPVPGALDAAMRARLAELFADNAKAGVRPDWQRAAAALALRQRLAVISGGPGTGKTTTVVALLACLLAADPDCRIALAAPTGKAAARMTEAIRGRAGRLPPDLRDKLPREASTVHRLLGAGPHGFAHDAARPLAIDALIVDEASMLDLALARRLLDAVPDGARIVLLGDKDQLAAVESGAVFAELSADPTLTPECRADLAAACGVDPDALQPPAASADAALPDAVVWFDRNFRFAADSGIGRLAAGVNAGRADATLAFLRDAADASLRWIADSGREPAAATWDAVAAGYGRFVDALRRDATDAAAATAAFDVFRVLCATREGARGVGAVNARVAAQVRRATGQAAAGEWFVGRPVIVRRNDPVLKLFNGDVGIALPDADGALAVCFPSPGGFRRVAPARLPPHDTAFALTIHQSQGSEFEQVLLLLPERPNRVLTRELLYTGITRAARRVLLAAGAAVLAAAIDTPTRRRSGLPARLRETPTTG